MNLPFHEKDLILFTGDSITECHRDQDDPDSLGLGYAGMIADRLGQVLHPRKLRFRNTGISADRIQDLCRRWDRDCLALQPDWISVLIGVNNTWRRYDEHSEPTSVGQFEAIYRELLQRVKEATSARLVLCAPFLLPVNPFVAGMREDLDPKIRVIHRLASEFNAVWVDFDAAFAAAQQRHIPSYWADDGVHPSIAGHALMAETWLGVVGS